MTKQSSKASVKSKKSKDPSSTSVTKKSKNVSKAELAPIQEQDLTEITIKINHYENLSSVYPSSFISAKCQYAEQEFPETEKILMTDEPQIIANNEFKIKFNPENPQDLNKLTSTPVIITLRQTTNITQPSFVEESLLSEKSKLTFDQELLSVESALSLYEAFTGDIIKKEDIVKSPSLQKKIKAKKKKKKEKKSSKSSKDSKKSKKSSKDSKKSKSAKGSKSSDKKSGSKNLDKKSKTNIEVNETEIGACVLDLLPLFFDKNQFDEFLPLILPQPLYDDRMVRHLAKPGIQVSVLIDKPFTFPCKINLLNIGIDSIYNIPSIMSEEMEYEICILLPSFNEMWQPILVKGGNYTSLPQKINYRQWADMKRTYTNVTSYKVVHDSNTIKNSVGNIDLEQVLSAEKPRINFNFIKRNVLLKDGYLAVLDQIKKFKQIIIEIHVKKKLPETSRTNSKLSTIKNKGTSNIRVEDENKPTNYLHLMAILDLSALLYPGVTKIRTAIPITTFQHEEAFLQGGLEKSYFYPPKEKPLDVVQVKDEAKGKKKGKKEKKGKGKSKGGSKSSKSKSSKSKSNKSKSSKSSKGSKNKKGKKGKKGKGVQIEEDLNLKSKLPAEPLPPPPPEPIIKVYDENGNPTFIVIELELTEPLVPQRSLNELQNSLNDIIQNKPITPKLIIDKQLTTEICQNVIKQIINLINEEYVCYIEKKKLCNCKKAADFLTYLKRCGIYHKILFTMIEAAGFMAQFKLNISLDNDIDQTQQAVVDEIFMFLTTKVNEVLHKSTPVSRTITENKNKRTDQLLTYAIEATEVGNLQLAEKYYLERISHNNNSANCWFDYAIFKLECDEFENAFVCLQEALSRNVYHKYSLMLIGLLLADKTRFKDAETCLLTMMVQHTRWVEGWIVLYLFYKETDNIGGMELSLEMANKYLDNPTQQTDDFLSREDLTWTFNICPKNFYFTTTILLIKMRTYLWAEKALACELKETGAVHYILAVICYYKRNYEHALEHLDRAKFFHGSDCAVQSLLGHCYLKLGNKQKALQEYLHILESFERPDYIHLLYLNLANIINDRKKARKIILTVCKNQPSPFTWSCAGLCHLQQNDLISAEECFSESVMLDNSIADSWGYLTLINIKLRHLSEAEICYGLALKNDLKNENLEKEIQIEFEKFKQKESFVNTF